LKKYIEKGHSGDMVPLYGEAYDQKHLSKISSLKKE